MKRGAGLNAGKEDDFFLNNNHKDVGKRKRYINDVITHVRCGLQPFKLEGQIVFVEETFY